VKNQNQLDLVMSRDPGVEPDPHYSLWPKTLSGMPVKNPDCREILRLVQLMAINYGL
jgi:hypothetical protein